MLVFPQLLTVGASLASASMFFFMTLEAARALSLRSPWPGLYGSDFSDYRHDLAGENLAQFSAGMPLY